jgi:hypothetical protein
VDHCLVGVDLDRGLQPIHSVAEKDFPVPVVEQHVMVGAEQDGMIDVGKSLVEPAFDVVSFGLGWWLVAAGPAASAVADGEGAALNVRA